MKSAASKVITLSFLLFISVMLVIYPRFLEAFLGEDHFLSSYLYLYGLGIPIFIFNMWQMIRLDALSFKVPGERKWLFIFIAGLSCSCLLHTVWVLAAALFPFKG